MVAAGFPDANPLILQAGQGGHGVDGRRDPLAVELAAEDDLPFSDVAGQVRDGVSFIILRHR